MDPAEAARREDPDPGPPGQERRGRHGRGPARAGGESGCQIAVAELPDRVVLGDPLHLVLGQADMGAPVQHGHRRGDGAGGPYESFQLFGDRQIARARQAVRDDRRLKGDHGTARGERLPYLGGQLHSDLRHVPIPGTAEAPANVSPGPPRRSARAGDWLGPVRPVFAGSGASGTT